MADRLTPIQRRYCMSRVHGKHTIPELRVRSALYHLGYRFRLHRADLPGRPDIVLPKCRAVIFVHGCFWHGHKGCQRSTRPASNVAFWNKKLDRNITRDQEIQSALRALGWSVITIWECQVRTKELIARLRRALSRTRIDCGDT